MTLTSSPVAPAEVLARRRPLRWALDTLSFYAVLTMLALTFLGWSMVASLLRPVLPRHRGRRLGQVVINRAFSAFLWTMRVTGIVRYDLTALDTLAGVRGTVFAANHPALLDILLLGSRLPRTVCIIKASLWRNPLLGGGKLAGYIRNDAALPLIRGAAAELQAGDNLLIFPEGTRTRGGALGAFRPGFALIARRARAPVQPLFIESNTPYLSKGWPLWRRPVFPLIYRVRLGPRRPVETRAEAFSEELHALFLRELPGQSVAA